MLLKPRVDIFKMPNLGMVVCEQHQEGAETSCAETVGPSAGPRANVTVSVGRRLFEQQQNPYFTESFQFQKQTRSEHSLFD